MTTKIFLLILTLGCMSICYGQVETAKGTIVYDSIYSEKLENAFGENPSRDLAIYLPPGYEESDQRYPVVYFLHGFGSGHIFPGLQEILDHAIETKRIRPFILVIPNQRTTYGGSFYSNSGVFGNWEDFTAFDLVGHMDKNYRTIARKESRGITGHSMGGYGALKIAMHHPDRFNTVYAISPGALTIVREYGPNSETFKELSSITTLEELDKTYFGRVMVAFGRSWSPNPDKAPFYCDLPFEYQEDELIVHQDVLQKWYDNMPLHMIDQNLENLKKLKAIKLDWGRNAGDRFTIQCDMFSQRLENVGITHFAEEYIGTHVSGIYTKEGRIPQQVLPFFDEYLEFENRVDPPGQNDEIAIKELLENYKTSINQADTTLGKKVFLANNTVNFIHPRGHEKGWEGIKTGIYEMFGSRFSKRDLKSSDEVITVFGDAAVLEFYWVFDATFSGANSTDIQTKGRETQVLKKVGDDWKIIHVHYSSLPVTGEREGF